MTHEQATARLAKEKLVAILRGVPEEKAFPLVEALMSGGVKILEFTFDHAQPGYIEDTCGKVSRIRNAFGEELLLGCGTVLSAQEADATRSAGAQLMICPHTDAALIRHGKALGAVCIPGAFSPTEVVTAYQAGADFVKLFPAGELGLSYIKALRAPLPHIPLIAVGGIRPENVGDFLSAGIAGFGVGSQLVQSKALFCGDFEHIRDTARAFTSAIAAWEEKA